MLKHILPSAFVGSLHKCKWFTLYYTTERRQRQFFAMTLLVVMQTLYYSRAPDLWGSSKGINELKWNNIACYTPW